MINFENKFINSTYIIIHYYVHKPTHYYLEKTGTDDDEKLTLSDLDLSLKSCGFSFGLIDTCFDFPQQEI